MNKELFESQWPQIRGILRDKWSNLTEEDIRQINGRYDQFMTKIQQRYGLTREEVEDQLTNWSFDRGFKGHREREYAHAEEHQSALKWLVLAGIPLLLLAGYFLHDLTKPVERSYAKPVEINQTLPTAQVNTPDSMLLMRIRQAIDTNAASLPASFSNITFDSSNGIVTIRGKVASQQEKDLISRITERIAGVRQVNNEVEVQ